MTHMPIRIGMKKQDVGMNLRSHSLDKLRQIVTTGALRHPYQQGPIYGVDL
jgi:hypothetical protein